MILLGKQYKPNRAKVRSKKKKGFVRTSRKVICKEPTYLDDEIISKIKKLNDDIK